MTTREEQFVTLAKQVAQGVLEDDDRGGLVGRDTLADAITLDKFCDEMSKLLKEGKTDGPSHVSQR